MPITIHNKQYVTVAERVTAAHEDEFFNALNTEVLNHDPVVVKATVTIEGRTYTGISSVDLNTLKQIEKQNPYEVAETSAVGRALGFAGYGVVDSIASADEMVKAMAAEPVPTTEHKETCAVCGADATIKSGTKNGKAWKGLFCNVDKTHVKWLKAN